MSKPNPPRHYGGDHQLQTNQQELLRNTANSPLLDGRTVTAELIGGAATKVAHGLGRVYQGWIIVGTNTAGRETPTEDFTTTDKDKFITLTVTVTHTVRLWVF